MALKTENLFTHRQSADVESGFYLSEQTRRTQRSRAQRDLRRRDRVPFVQQLFRGADKIDVHRRRPVQDRAPELAKETKKKV